jgi:hypothetical protein
VSLPKPSFAGAAGGGWRREVSIHCPARTLLTGIVLICRLPRRGVFSGKSPRTCRRWRLFSCACVIGYISTREIKYGLEISARLSVFPSLLTPPVISIRPSDSASLSPTLERASAYERMQRFSNHPLSSRAAEVPRNSSRPLRSRSERFTMFRRA